MIARTGDGPLVRVPAYTYPQRILYSLNLRTEERKLRNKVEKYILSLLMSGPVYARFINLHRSRDSSNPDLPFPHYSEILLTAKS